MFNKNVSLALVIGKQVDKWIPVSALVKYGLFAQNIAYLEDKGYLTTSYSPEVGTLIKLTIEGYYEALKLVNRNYDNKGAYVQ